MIQQPSASPAALAVTRLNPLALAAGFGVAGVVLVLVFGAVMGILWGMMDGRGMMGGGGMMPGSSSGAPGLFAYALLSGLLGGAIAGGVTAWVYNAVMVRRTEYA